MWLKKSMLKRFPGQNFSFFCISPLYNENWIKIDFFFFRRNSTYLFYFYFPSVFLEHNLIDMNKVPNGVETKYGPECEPITK